MGARRVEVVSLPRCCGGAISVRALDDGDVLRRDPARLAEEARLYDGVHATMTREEFARLGVCGHVAEPVPPEWAALPGATASIDPRAYPPAFREAHADALARLGIAPGAFLPVKVPPGALDAVLHAALGVRVRHSAAAAAGARLAAGPDGPAILVHDRTGDVATLPSGEPVLRLAAVFQPLGVAVLAAAGGLCLDGPPEGFVAAWSRLAGCQAACRLLNDLGPAWATAPDLGGATELLAATCGVMALWHLGLPPNLLAYQFALVECARPAVATGLLARVDDVLRDALYFSGMFAGAIRGGRARAAWDAAPTPAARAAVAHASAEALLDLLVANVPLRRESAPPGTP